MVRKKILMKDVIIERGLAWLVAFFDKHGIKIGLSQEGRAINVEEIAQSWRKFVHFDMGGEFNE